MKPIALIAVAVLAFASVAHAQTVDHAAHHGATASTTATPSTEGEVRKLDKDQGKVTLRHGRIENLDMPGMTMVFKAADPRLLEGLNVGDKVRFAADNRNGVLTVTAIEPVR